MTVRSSVGGTAGRNQVGGTCEAWNERKQAYYPVVRSMTSSTPAFC